MPQTGDAEAKRLWLQRVLGVTLPPPRGGGSLIAYRSSLLAFAGAKSRVAGQIDTLARTLATTLPERAKLARDLAAELQDLNDEIGDTIDAALNAAAEQRSMHNPAIRRAISGYLDFLATDELVRKVDGNPLVPVSVRATLSDALQAIANHLE